MSVYVNMVWLAIQWTDAGEHFDLVYEPSEGYGIFDQTGGDGSGLWRERLSEIEALSRLKTWKHEDTTPTFRSHSQVTPRGREWLGRKG
jgi:hypothetical protein